LAVGGVGPDLATAEAACIGEAIERWQSYSLPGDHSIEARFETWPQDEAAVDPARWVLFHPEQYAQPGFPFQPLTPATACRWTCCRQAVSGQPWWVPEEFVYLDAPAIDRHYLCPGISTGLACGQVGQPVLLRGLQEAIERDAVMGAWWARYPLEEWPGETVLGCLGPTWEARLCRQNLRYRFFRIRSPFSSHVTMVTVEGEDHEGFCHSVGSACRASREESWLKATLEAVQGRHYVSFLKKEIQEGLRRPPNELLDFPDHAVYYSMHPDRLPETNFCQPSTPSGEGEGEFEEVSHLIERLGPGRPVLFRNVTPTGISRQEGSWYVLRILVPGLQPLHGNDQFAHLGGPLWKPRTLAEWQRIPPHPFP
jgi:ribosomal protein S12 methylthiotransferase accessory factor